MRFLVVGAGAVGGYFGGRMLQAGCDVTFLVRPRRATELAATGLVIRSPYGDARLDDPRTLIASAIKQPFDVVVLSCKSYDLTEAVRSFAPAVGPTTLILPLLNGMAHLDVLDEAFGRERVLGGLCTVILTLNACREVVQLQPIHSLIFGSRDEQSRQAVLAIEEAIRPCKFDGEASPNVMQDMWEKWMFLASMAASTSLMRTSIGNILAASGGRDFVTGLVTECKLIAGAVGHAPRPPFVKDRLSLLTMEGSPLTASMFRDIEAGLRIEADHVIGDLIARGEAANIATPRLRIAYTHLKAYERQRNETSRS
jgi:2-dehydropantoate 2-reductase